jgi:hypothetical protein
MTPIDPSKCILKRKDINTVPGREQSTGMPAIPSPPTFVGMCSLSTERQAVEATDVKEGIWIVGGKSLNTAECPDKVFKHQTILHLNHIAAERIGGSNGFELEDPWRLAQIK